jgi:hypothetical protein
MNNALIVVAVVVLLLVVLFLLRVRKTNQAMGDVVAQLCAEFGVPDRPFNLTAAVREVEAGTRPGIPRDGRWWVATGFEQIGDDSRTRLLTEEAVADEPGVRAAINELIDTFGGTAFMPPHLEEGRFVGTMPGVDSNIIYARITGRLRPIGGWLVAVPPGVIASGLRHERR